MAEWAIQRRWKLSRENDEHLISTSKLIDFPACGLLGAAGLGKTYELDSLCKALVGDGLTVSKKRFVEVGPDLTAESLRRGLLELSERLSRDTVLLLDALDEAMVPIRMIANVVAEWIRCELRETRPHVMISCRSAVWPEEIDSALQEVYGDQVAVVALQPLSRKQQELAVASEGISDSELFFQGIANARAASLAEQPMTLKLLVREFQRSGTITANRCELFDGAIKELVHERRERHESGAVPAFTPAEIIEAAERLACILLLSDQRGVTLGDEPIKGCLRHTDLSGLPADGRPLHYEMLRSLSRSALCDSGDATPFQFAHRLYAEYLAGRRLAGLPLHQSCAFLASPAGWEAGVAGPLRETAAFAASLNPDVASWIAETDPEVIGLSEVADNRTRRRAVLELLQLCRDRRMTDSQLFGDGVIISGLRYPNAVEDLAPVLRERHTTSSDVLECAIRMVREWRLVDLCSDLADLTLDRSAPLEARKTAGYTLLDLAPSETRLGLKKLIFAGPDEVDEELKGVALQCNWPENITSRELLVALTPRQRNNFHGSYAHFLWQLVNEKFDAADCRVDGLRWAHRQFALCESNYDLLYKIAQRIVHAALNHLDDRAMADELLRILADVSLEYRDSPLRAIHDISSRDNESLPPLQGQTAIRRQLIELIVCRFPRPDDLRRLARDIPHLVVLDDFAWLIELAQDETRDIEIRTRYADLIRLMPWMENSNCVELWLKCRHCEPIATVLDYPLFVELDSEQAIRQRKHHQLMHGSPSREQVTLEPPPAERVAHLLRLAETENPLYFRRVCKAMTLKPDSTWYRFERFLTVTPGWENAPQPDRRRILEAAQAYLTFSDNYDPERIRKSRLNSIHGPAMSAIWLIQEQSPDWLDELPDDWWKRWAWYILRELHFRLSDEPNDKKRELFRRLHSRAGKNVREDVRRLVVGQYKRQAEAAQSLLSATLELFDGVRDPEIDQLLCKRIETGKVVQFSLRRVAQFVLRRCPNDAAAVILPHVRAATDTEPGSATVELVVALFSEQCATHWADIREFLLSNPKAAAESLAQFASGDRLWMRQNSEALLSDMTPDHIGELVELLFDFYPPDSDPEYDGAYGVTPANEARMLRDQLLNWLAEGPEEEDQAHAEQRLRALRSLESKYGSRFAWLRRPRARAERAFRLQHRKAIPVPTVADVLCAADKRLIRHDSDALDGVLAALDSLERETRQSSPSILNRYWNTPSKQSPSPKEEEFVSDEICLAIRNYFRSFAVVADREVQLFRRTVPKSGGGRPGSEVDVLTSVPKVGVEAGSPIIVPIEVKRSCDNRARTAMRTQLVERYMEEAGTAIGVYVLAWLDAENLASHHCPKWSSIEEAKSYLEEQAKQIRETQGLDVRVGIINLTLR